MHPDLKNHVRLGLLALMALPLAACETMNRSVESVHQPVVSYASYVFDIQSGAGLSSQDAARLDDWFASQVFFAVGLSLAADFGRAHPQFHVAVPTRLGSKALTRVSLDAHPQMASGLSFSHRLHLDKQGGVARMAAIDKIEEIMAAVSIPVMAKCRIGHVAEARVLETLGVDFIDESEVLTPADEENHVWKHDFRVPFVCGCRNLGEALRRIAEGAAMMRTKGEAGSGNIVEAVRHLRAVRRELRRLTTLDPAELVPTAKELQAPFELVQYVAEHGKLPVPNFAAGGVATPADAALCMMLGAESVFVGSGIFKSADPARRAAAIVRAVTHWQDPAELLEACRGLAGAMHGLDVAKLTPEEMLSRRGW